MTVSLELVPAFTRAGLDAVLNAQADGFSARITHLAFGDGGTSGYTPQGTETTLRRERERVPITFSMKDGTGSFRVRGAGAPSDIEYWVREVGIVLEDGTLLAVWSDPDRAITGRGPGAELEFDIKLVLAALPGDAVEIVVTPGGDRTLAALAAQVVAQARMVERAARSEGRAIALAADIARQRRQALTLAHASDTARQEVRAQEARHREDREAAMMLAAAQTAAIAAQLKHLTIITTGATP